MIETKLTVNSYLNPQNAVHYCVFQQVAVVLFKITVAASLIHLLHRVNAKFGRGNFLAQPSSPHSSSTLKEIKTIILLRRCWIWDQSERHVQGKGCCTNGRSTHQHISNQSQSYSYSISPTFTADDLPSKSCSHSYSSLQMIWYGTEHNPVRLPRHSQQFSGNRNQIW